jgi:hypothetical protein
VEGAAGPAGAWWCSRCSGSVSNSSSNSSSGVQHKQRRTCRCAAVHGCSCSVSNISSKTQ